MADFDGFPAGSMCWVDLGTSDMSGAMSFYGELFGWKPEGAPNEDFGGYVNMMLNGKRVAGIAPVMSPEQPVVWSNYVAVDDADKTTELVREAGGTVIVEPMQVGDYGKFGFFIDTSGAATGIWQAGEHKGVQLASESGTWGWSELNSRNTSAAREFYASVFGWTTVENEDANMPYWHFMSGDRMVGGLMEMPPGIPAQVPSMWLTYFSVDDLDGSVAKVQQLGGAVSMPRMDIRIGSLAVVSDPQGATFALFEPASEQ